MPKSDRLAVPKRPTVGVALTSEDEAITLDAAIGGLPAQVKAALDRHTAVLESHAAALEMRMSKILHESEERLRAQSKADIGAINEHVGAINERLESLRPAASLAQRFPGLVARCDEKQEVEAEQEPDPGRGDVPVLVDAGASRETRRIVEECAEKLWKLQARAVDRVQSKWTESLKGLLSRDGSLGLRPEVPPLQLTPSTRASPGATPASGESSFSRCLPPAAGDAGAVPDGSQKDGPPEQPARRASVCSAEDDHLLMSTMSQYQLMKSLHSHFLSGHQRSRPLTRLERARVTVEVLATLLLLANVIWMAIATELNMQYAKKGTTAPSFFFWIDLSFLIAMCIEVITKLFLYRMEFFVGAARRWNAFDVALIILAGVDLVLSAANLSFVRVLRGLRAIRATRVMRTVVIVPELRLMFASITASASSLFWAFVLIIMVLFLCAMGVQQTVHSALETGGLGSQHPQLMQHYGTLPDTMLSLFMAISGGADWKDLAEPLFHISRLYTIPYILFIILTIFGLLNILTAVFVEKTSNITRIDPELVIQESLTEEAKAVSQLLQILGEADTDATGTITKAEFEAKLEDPRFTAQMQLLDLNILEAQGVFLVLDHDRSGEIEIEQLVYGLLRMKGNARSMDMNTLLLDTKRLMTKVKVLEQTLEANFKDIRVALATQSSHRHPFAFKY